MSVRTADVRFFRPPVFSFRASAVGKGLISSKRDVVGIEEGEAASCEPEAPWLIEDEVVVPTADDGPGPSKTMFAVASSDDGCVLPGSCVPPPSDGSKESACERALPGVSMSS